MGEKCSLLQIRSPDAAPRQGGIENRMWCGQPGKRMEHPGPAAADTIPATAKGRVIGLKELAEITGRRWAGSQITRSRLALADSPIPCVFGGKHGSLLLRSRGRARRWMDVHAKEATDQTSQRRAVGADGGRACVPCQLAPPVG